MSSHSKSTSIWRCLVGWVLLACLLVTPAVAFAQGEVPYIPDLDVNCDTVVDVADVQLVATAWSGVE